MSNNVRDEQESTPCLQHRMVFSFSLTKEGSFCYITEEMMIALFAWLISRTFQPTNNIFLSQQISNQYFQPWLISQANMTDISKCLFAKRQQSLLGAGRNLQTCSGVITLAETWQCLRQKQNYPVIVVVNKPTVA